MRNSVPIIIRMLANFRDYISRPGLGPEVIKATVGVGSLRIAGLVFGFLVGVQLARGLGAEGYGIYGVAMSLVAILTFPVQFGFPQLLTREVATAYANNKWKQINGIFRWSKRTSSAIAALVATIAAASILFSGQLTESPWHLTLLVGLGLIPIVGLIVIYGATLRGLQRIVSGQAPIALVRPALFSLLLLVTQPSSPVLAMAVGLVSAGLTLLMAMLLLRRILPTNFATIGQETDTKYWWTSALPLAMTDGMRILQNEISVPLIGALVTMAAGGLYRVASSTQLLIAMPITLLNVVGAPIIAKLNAEQDRRSLQKLLPLFALGGVAGALLLTLPFMIWGELLLGTLFGSEFSEANRTLLVLCLGTIFSAALGPNIVLLNMTGHQGAVTRASAISLLLLVLTSPVLILRFGNFGAAAASAISLCVWNLMLRRSSMRLIGLDGSIFAICRNRRRTN